MAAPNSTTLPLNAFADNAQPNTSQGVGGGNAFYTPIVYDSQNHQLVMGAQSVNLPQLASLNSITAASFSTDSNNNVNSINDPKGNALLAFNNVGTDSVPIYKLQANAVPRTNSLSVLKALTSGGGELTSATDVAAIVQLNGVAGSGTASVYSPMAPGVWTDSTSTLTSLSGANLNITTSLNAGAAGQLIFKTAATTSSANSSGNISFATGSVPANASTTAGQINFFTGNSLNLSRAAPSINFQAGNGPTTGTATGASGGFVNLSAGSCSATNGVGGGVYLYAGAGATPALGGQLQLIDGAGTTILSVGGGTAGVGTLGFYGVAPAPVVQPTAHATTAGFTASTGTAVVSGSTFTGGSGATAYTIGDIVLALKTLGLLAA